MFRTLAVAGLMGMAIQAATARNPVINGSFDFQLVGWLVIDGRADWIRETDDASTVVRLVNVGRLRKDQGPQAATKTGLSQCLRLSPDTYSLSARALVPAGQWKDHRGEISVTVFDNPDCSWLDGKGRSPMVREVVGDGKWHTSTPLTFTIAAGSVEIRLSSVVRGSTAEDAEVWFDDVVLAGKATHVQISPAFAASAAAIASAVRCQPFASSRSRARPLRVSE